MSQFVENPAHLSKSRLKSDLVAHSVELPPVKSKKEVYVGLHLQHIGQKNAVDFSSDEEDQVQDVSDKEEDTEMPDPSGLTDDDLKAALLEHGVKAGPIVASTRALYEKKLRKLLQSNGHGCLNGVEKGVLYSDSEEEEENGEEEDRELGSEGEKEETVKQSDQAQQGSSQVELCFQNGGFVYPQCFLLSSRLHARASRNREPSPKWNSGNAIESSEQSRPPCSQIPVGISRASSVDQHSGLGSGLDMPIVDTMKNQSLYYTPKASSYEWKMKLTQEPVKDTVKNMFPNTDATTTGIYATRRRPIKGAAGRPVQYAYPDTPVSPTTLEKREVERRLVPIQIQILVFLIVTCLLYLIYVCVEDNSFGPSVALLDRFYQGSDSEEGLLLQAETQDVPAPSRQE
ncbi:LEM domain-containing protein 1 isoform X4 [Perca flavescens]|uniref:LEM domain-containing protein 1 isoform X4 n=1 Tax=Perca flavescens TaxID=8167 RepID=UPI00106ECE51|nr:lamina-associated polypeptide 2, isoforms beta/gamma-like isoform X4 [Perca flavescens]